MCKNMRCRKRFEVAGVQSVAFLDWSAFPDSGHYSWTPLLIYTCRFHLCCRAWQCARADHL